MKGLIGYTGFVGGNLRIQASFDKLYNSRNIREIEGESFELLVCSGAPAVKWKANQEPEADRSNIEILMNHLKKVRCERLVLISTVDVYKSPLEVDEDTPIETDALEPYGKHRRQLETFIAEQFPKVHIIRLPGLFGPGLKKNIIYDFMNENLVQNIDCEHEFQFYNLERLYLDITKVIENDLEIVNFSTEPVSVREVAKHAFDLDFANRTGKARIRYDMKTKFARLLNGGSMDHYLMSKSEQLDQIRDFVNQTGSGDPTK
ncbi:NAD-dependent epimerase/dehydratase family protein [Cohnella candidum]|uniref:NAD(P)-dependent oxidoreductase n=1 Tax=Cohnella candidum TaxID=2674991 RepID=A0A3G3K161_9BACL|nr:NAD(P)-dependent oxidoreductase [Cohnella candidum]AYQ74162.1 NAD(P)-dependent oxidoreductase [Cohnella candidum]